MALTVSGGALIHSDIENTSSIPFITFFAFSTPSGVSGKQFRYFVLYFNLAEYIVCLCLCTLAFPYCILTVRYDSPSLGNHGGLTSITGSFTSMLFFVSRDSRVIFSLG